MAIGDYVIKSLATLVFTGSMFLSGCRHPQTNVILPNEIPPYPSKLEHRINQEEGVPNNIPDKYAVLISGDDELRDVYDLSFAYQVLLEIGFKKANIYILDKEGMKTPIYPVDDLSSRYAVNMLFSHLSKKVESQDLLFVYITDHGVRETYKPANDVDAPEIKVTEIVLPGPNLNEVEFKELLDRLNSCITIVLADICYGGGLANRFSKGKYVGVSSSTEEEEADGSAEHTFGRHFMEAYREISKADSDQNMVVDLSEAFTYAKRNHPSTNNGENTPFLKSELSLETLTLQ